MKDKLHHYKTLHDRVYETLPNNPTIPPKPNMHIYAG